jgi:hypothetical protein
MLAQSFLPALITINYPHINYQIRAILSVIVATKLYGLITFSPLHVIRTNYCFHRCTISHRTISTSRTALHFLMSQTRDFSTLSAWLCLQDIANVIDRRYKNNNLVYKQSNVRSAWNTDNGTCRMTQYVENPGLKSWSCNRLSWLRWFRFNLVSLLNWQRLF